MISLGNRTDPHEHQYELRAYRLWCDL